MKKLFPLYLMFGALLAAEPFLFEGEKYDTTLPALDFSLPPWKQGDAEPPVLPNQAYVAAKKVFDEQFGRKTKAYVHFVVLRQWAGGGSDHSKTFSAYEIVFVEQPSADEKAKPWRQQKSDGASSIYIANMHYYVLMDGTVIAPAKVGSPASTKR